MTDNKQYQRKLFVKLLLLLIYMQFSAVSHANIHQFSVTDSTCIAHINLEQFSDILISDETSLILKTNHLLSLDIKPIEIFVQLPSYYFSRAPPQ